MKPHSRLLLATSLRGDPAAELRRALPFARALGAEVRLLHVAPDPVITYSEFTATAASDLEMAVEQEVEEARRRLQAAIEEVGARDVAVGAEVARGDVRVRTVEVAAEWGATLVAVHPGEHDVVERVLLGTTSRYLLHQLDVPLLLLRPLGARRDPVHEMVVPVEPRDPEHQPPHDVIGALALGLPARLHYVSVLAEEDLLRGLAREQCHEAARSRLDRMLQVVSRSVPLDVQTLGEVVYARRASDGVLQFAYRVEASLIALRSHGRSAPSRALLGSVCDQVATRASCSVLVFPR